MEHKERIIFFCQSNREKQISGKISDTLLFGLNHQPHPVTYVGWPTFFITRALAHFWFPLYTLLLALRYRFSGDIFIVQDAFIGTIGLLRRLHLVPKTIFLNIAFYSIYNKSGLLGKKYLLMAAKSVDGTIILRKNYHPFNKNPPNTFFIPLGIDTTYFVPSAKQKEFIISVGRAERDHMRVLKIARRTGMPFVVVTGKKDAVQNTVPNVAMFQEIPLQKLRELYSECKAALILFKPDPTGMAFGGQTVVLELLSMNKPIIINHADWLRDYGLDRNPNITIVKTDDDVVKALGAVRPYESHTFIEHKLSTKTFGKKIHKVIDHVLASHDVKESDSIFY